jgi:hypothetical protein
MCKAQTQVYCFSTIIQNYGDKKFYKIDTRLMAAHQHHTAQFQPQRSQKWHFSRMTIGQKLFCQMTIGENISGVV